MLLSIVIPVYNTEKYLVNCLDSIVSQLGDRRNNIEILVVNDGSPDNSGAIIDKFQKKYPSIIEVINKRNGGLSDARNAAIGRCKGEFIWFVDSDDSIEETCLDGILGFLQETTADYIMFNASRVDINGKVIGTFQHHGPVSTVKSIRFEIESIQRYFSRHMVWMRIYRRTLIGHLRFPVGITHEDIHFDLRILALEPEITFLNGVFYRHYFDNPVSITNTVSVRNALDVLWVYTDLETIFSSNTYEPRIYAEYLKIAIKSILSRALYLLTCDFEKRDKKKLFNEHVTTAGRFRLKLVDHDQDIANTSVLQRLLLYTSTAKSGLIPYSIAAFYLLLKDAYDLVGELRYRLLKSIRSD